MIKSNMPQLGSALFGWETTITLGVVTQTINNGLVEESVSNVRFKGTVQPLKPTQIQFKPEALRRFQWLQIHAMTTKPILDTNDIIEYNGKKFKVLGVYDYSLNGFYEYHLVEDFQDAD